MSEKWDPANAARYTCAAEMPAAVRRSWYEANKPPLTKPTSQSQPKSSTVEMNAEAAARWNAWATKLIDDRGRALAYIIGSECGKIERRLTARIDTLERELGELRAAAEVERAGKIVDLPNWRRKYNAA
jgi:hypothetical protein